MTLSSKIDLARSLFGTERGDAQTVTRTSGTAYADSEGGTVLVELDEGDVVEVGCIGSVRQGQTVTIHVQNGNAQVIAAEGWGDAIQTTVDEAAEVANATNQHFWSDDNGAHITEVTQDEWNDSSDPNYHSGYNSLWNSLGLLFRKAMNNLVSITQSGTSFYDGSGNAAANVTASFGSSGAQIGKAGESHIELDYRSMRMIDKGGIAYFDVRDLRGADGYATITDTFTGDGSTTSFVLSMGIYSTATTTVTVSDGSGGNVMLYQYLVVFSAPPTNGATITVSYLNDTADTKSYTLGTRASGSNVGAMSVAMGKEVSASGGMSVAMGNKAVASGMHCLAFGDHTIASRSNGMAIGMYNVDDRSLFAIGNGSSDNARSNAMSVSFTGDVTAASEFKAGGGTPLVPIGTILDFAASTAPSGYLVCDGSAVSRTTYSALYAVIGTTWGTGDGSTTFNIPDFRGRTSIGSGTGTGGNATSHALGSKGGDEKMQSHSHELTNTDFKIQAIKNESGVAGSFNLQAHSSGNNRYALASSNSANLTYYSATATSGSGSGGNMQPFATVTKIIRAI